MSLTRSQIAQQRATSHGLDLTAPLQIGGHYASITEHQGVAYLSGQVPRIGSTVVATGRVGQAVDLQQARDAAEVCALRLLAILDQAHGLDRVAKVLKLGVFVQSDATFTQHSEVADAASDLLHEVFGEAGRHARTSVGVAQLPKNAAVEIDAIVALLPATAKEPA